MKSRTRNIIILISCYVVIIICAFCFMKTRTRIRQAAYNNNNYSGSIRTPTKFYVRKSIANAISRYRVDNGIVDNNFNTEDKQLIDIAGLTEFNRFFTSKTNFTNFLRSRYNFFNDLRIQIYINRENILEDSFMELQSAPAFYFIRRKLFIRFINELGADAGGLSREWVNLFINEIIKPENGYFKIANEKDGTVIPNAIQPDNYSHQSEMYRLLGRVLAYCLILEITVDTKIDYIVFKQILNETYTLDDFRDVDPDLYNGLLAFKDDPSDLCFENDDGFELKENGLNIPVTKETFDQYLDLYLNDKYVSTFSLAVDFIRNGLFEILTEQRVNSFKAWEFYILLNGQPILDVEDWKRRTGYNRYTENDQIIKWFWEYVEELDENQRVKLLYAITSYKQLPLESNTTNFYDYIASFMTINYVSDTTRYPECHTCIRQLDLPEYQTKEELIFKFAAIVEPEVLEFHTL